MTSESSTTTSSASTVARPRLQTTPRLRLPIVRPVKGTNEILESLADLDPNLSFDVNDQDDTTLADRRTPPIPVFVRLSRLVDPPTSAQPVEVDEPCLVLDLVEGDDVIETLGSETDGTDRPAAGEAPSRPWSESIARPAFQIGLAAMAAATAVAAQGLGSPTEERVAGTESAPVEVGQGTGSSPSTAAVVPGNATGEAAVGSLAQATTVDEADLSIVGTASSDSGQVTWTATVRNAGPNPDPGPITVVHTIPSGLKFVSSTGSGWDCVDNEAASTISCTLAESLDSDSRHKLSIVTTDGDAPADTKLPSTMSVVGQGSDPDLGNNTIAVTAIGRGQGDDDANGTVTSGAAQDDTDDETGASLDSSETTTADELPKTGSGWTLTLTGVGLSLCLAGRRMIRVGAVD